MAQESEWQFHEPDPRQAGEGFGAGSLCQCVWLSPHLCITDVLGTDALGTNQYLRLWHSCQKPAGGHGCSVTSSPCPLSWAGSGSGESWRGREQHLGLPSPRLLSMCLWLWWEERKGECGIEKPDLGKGLGGVGGVGGDWVAPGTFCMQAGALRDREERFDPRLCREGQWDRRGSGLCKAVMGGGRWRIKWHQGEWE